MRSLFALVFLVGCGGVSEDDFKKEYAARTCGLLFECAGETTTSFMLFENEEECAGLFELAFALVPDECEYDKQAATDCLDALDAAECSVDAAEPTACLEVYTGDAACLVLGSSTATFASE